MDESPAQGLSLADLASLVEAGGQETPFRASDEVLMIQHADELVRRETGQVRPDEVIIPIH